MELEQRQGIFGSCKFFSAQVPDPSVHSLFYLSFFFDWEIKLVQAHDNDATDHLCTGTDSELEIQAVGFE